MSIEVRGFKRYYAAASPEKLELIVEAKRATLRDSLSELTALYNLKGGSSSIRCYNGIEGIKSTYEDILTILRRNDFYLAISDQQRWIGLDQDYFEKYKRRRMKLGVKTRLLLTDTPGAKEEQKRTSKLQRTGKTPSQENHPHYKPRYHPLTGYHPSTCTTDSQQL